MPRRFLVSLLYLVVVCGFHRPAHAQAVGDSIRARLLSGHPWYTGRLTVRDEVALVIHRPSGDSSFARQRVQRVEVWRRNNPVVVVGLSGVVGAGLGALISQVSVGGYEQDTSAGKGALGGALFGLATGAVIYLASPGHWRQIAP